MFKFFKRAKESTVYYRKDNKNPFWEDFIEFWIEREKEFCFPDELPENDDEQLDLFKTASIVDMYKRSFPYSYSTSEIEFNNFIFRIKDDIDEQSCWILYKDSDDNKHEIAYQRMVYEITWNEDDPYVTYRKTDEDGNVKVGFFHHVDMHGLVPHVLYLQEYIKETETEMRKLGQRKKLLNEKYILQTINETQSCK